MLRLAKLGSNALNFVNNTDKLHNAFIKRGYPKKVAKTQLNLFNATKPKINSTNDPTFITEFYPGLHTFNQQYHLYFTSF